MPRLPRAVPPVLAGFLLLTACGSHDASPGAGIPDVKVSVEALCPSDYTQYGATPSADRPTATPSGTPTSLPLPSPVTDDDGVRVTKLYAWGPDSGCVGVDHSAEFEIVNTTSAAATYTVTLSFSSASGTAAGTAEAVVEAVGPGRTGKGAAAMTGTVPGDLQVTGVKVIRVRSVPVAEASSASGPCPASGVRVYADRGDAAMGLRAVGLHLVNCGTEPYALDGYPELEIQDEDHNTVKGVRILRGTQEIGGGLGGQEAPQALTLRPGEAARTTLAWRNTTQAGTPVNAPYARVWARPGADPVMVVPELDLGTTGRLGVGPWRRDESYRDQDQDATARP
ncbi:DUF4232 domain-containing protein [Streptomyces sp. NPDC057412]|uniref:DUF4232 domain-containing protein n=1 Tax=Streptomyces sp. NPDC057412 TaxID=3346123 RepID=UPI00368E83EC